MGILSWILFGLLAGIVAKFLMPGKDGGGIVVTILLGVAGAFLDGFIAVQLGWGEFTGGFHLNNFLMAVGGALLLLLLNRFLKLF
jgi:uncharacterized membrane protein YeaQ/YmgE (transglycosylase-associated protein family)